MTYSFKYEGKAYDLESEACSFFMNDEEQPIRGVNPRLILAELAQSDAVHFAKAYYDQACEGCEKNRSEGGKYFDFLEFHFYLFSKNKQYVMSSLSIDYEYKTLPDLLEEGRVDGSYIVNVNVCQQCGDYTIDIEYGLW